MGNWHCVPSSCAEVFYTEFKQAPLRWRYPGEDWNEIDGDDYSLTKREHQCPVRYNLKYQTIDQGGILDTNKTYDTGGVTGPIYAWGLSRVFENQISLGIKQDYCGINSNPQCGSTRAYRKWFYHRGGRLDINGNTLPPGNTVGYSFLNLNNGWGFKLFDLRPGNGQLDNCGDCTFKVFKNGQVIYTEVRTDCPDVEKLPCKLEEKNKRIEIKKLPFIERVEVVPYAYICL